MDERCMMRRRISALDFAIWETEVFLDTHPNCKTALKARNKYREQRKQLLNEYEKKFGAYVTTRGSVAGTDMWTWIDNPWPWDYEGDN